MTLLPFQGGGGQKSYQVNLRSRRAPIRVLLIDRDLDSSAPVVFPVPPSDDFCPMPTPPSTPGGLQRFTLVTPGVSAASPLCSQDPTCSDQQMAPVDLSGRAASSSDLGEQMFIEGMVGWGGSSGWASVGRLDGNVEGSAPPIPVALHLRGFCGLGGHQQFLFSFTFILLGCIKKITLNLRYPVAMETETPVGSFRLRILLLKLDVCTF